MFAHAKLFKEIAQAAIGNGKESGSLLHLYMQGLLNSPELPLLQRHQRGGFAAKIHRLNLPKTHAWQSRVWTLNRCCLMQCQLFDTEELVSVTDTSFVPFLSEAGSILHVARVKWNT